VDELKQKTDEAHEMNESMITFGCIMAEVSEHESGNITSTTKGVVKLTFCFTSESEGNRIIVTPQMSQLGNLGFLPIAIARIDPSDPTQFFLRSVNGLSASLRVALEHEGCDLVHIALSCLACGQDASTVLN